MCSGGGGGGGGLSIEERELIRQQNEQNALQFERSQQLAEDQFEWQQQQAEDALLREAARQERIGGAVAQINDVFRGREPIYKQIEDATFSINRDDLLEDRDNGRRDLKFGLARSGLYGSSVDVDRNARIQDRFNRGLLDARSTAQAAGNNARAADAQIQANLVNSASTGSFSGSQLLDAASGALSATSNPAPVIIPNLANDTYFSDIVNGLGSLAYQAGSVYNNYQNRGGSTIGGGTQGNIRG